MAVQNIECQIAQAQIARYLQGAAYSPEAFRQLEAHISECADCSKLLHIKRQSLISEAAVPEAFSPKPEVKRPSNPRQSLIDAIKNQAAAVVQAPANLQSSPDETVTIETTMDPSPSWKQFSRPLALSGALAVVLVGMSWIAQDPSRIFGTRGLTANQSQPGSVSTKGTSAIPIVEPFQLKDIVPPAFVDSVSNFDGTNESIEATRRNTVDLLKLTRFAPSKPVAPISAPATPRRIMAIRPAPKPAPSKRTPSKPGTKKRVRSTRPKPSAHAADLTIYPPENP